MESVMMAIFYIFSFLAMYVQVFFLVTFLENRKSIVIRTEDIDLPEYPEVTIIVPCYNEEKTVEGTVNSLLDLDYKKDALKIIVVDDGSKDNTWKILNEKYASHERVQIFRKENGGKHTALNFALERITTPFVGCLDADSFVHKEALKRIMTFFNNKDTMAVAPSIVVSKPKNILQWAQKAEYDMAHYNKKMLAFLGGIHVTPGPFSIFRKKVFDDLGPYRKAHNTEDQEIALRMQKHGYKIDHAPDAYVYTNSPNTVKKLYKQRVRWIYGFIKNAMDYRFMIFRKRYGHVALFTIPSGIISVLSVVFLFIFLGYNLFRFISQKILQFQVVGGDAVIGSSFKFDWFFFNTKSLVFVSFILYSLVIVALLNGRKMVEGKRRISTDILYFFIIYSVVAPFWLIKSVFNALRSKETSWTSERDSKNHA